MNHRSRHPFSSLRTLVCLPVALFVSSGCGPRPAMDADEIATTISMDPVEPREADPGLPLGPYRRNDPLSEDVSVARAARFLDTVATNWGEKHGCVTCHTNGYYLTAPNEVFGDRPAFQKVRAFAEAFVDSWDEESLPTTEVFVATAAFLAINDAEAGRKLGAATVKALDQAWDHQSEEGHWENWVKCNWPPFESDDHYGVTLMAVAVGMAEDNYRQTDRAEAGMTRIGSYIASHPPTHLHQKAMLLWAAKYNDGLVDDGDRERWIEELFDRQRPDGGFASGELGSWRQREGEPSELLVNVESDGYGTGFVVFVLREAGVEASDPRIKKAVTWLLTHQRAEGHWWTQSLRNESDTSNFLTHAGTTFALKALVATGLPES